MKDVKEQQKNVAKIVQKELNETLPEDLNYLSELTGKRLKENKEIFQGNTAILALNRTGMMIIAGADGNKGVEEQDYTITTLGYMVDRYVKSYDLGEVKYQSDNAPIPNEEIDKMFDD